MGLNRAGRALAGVGLESFFLSIATAVAPKGWHSHWAAIVFLVLALQAAMGTVLSVVLRRGPLVAREIPFETARDADLSVVLEREEFHPFQLKALLLVLKLRVVNRTDKTKYLGPIRWQIDPPDIDGAPAAGWMPDIDVLREKAELEKRQPNQLAGVIGPSDQITGRLVMALPHQPWGGVGGYTITLEDELAASYTLRRERRGRRTILGATGKR
jgi:hypothetical protein